MTQILLFGILVVAAFAMMLVPPALRALPRRVEQRAPSDGRRPPAPWSRSPRIWAMGTGLVVVVLAIGIVSLPTEEPTPAQPLLAVVPFESIGAQEPFIAAGLTDELTTRLSGIAGIRVTSTSVARAVAVSEDDWSSRGVAYVLEGSVSIDGEGTGRHLHVRTRLVDVDAGTQIWGEVYNEPIAGLFDVQGRIARRVAAAMNVALLEPQQAELATPRTENLEAYERYIQGVTLRRGTTSLDMAVGALRAFDAAVTMDPGFAGAWAGRASMHAWLGHLHGYPNEKEAARADLARAEELDVDDPDVVLASAATSWMVDFDAEAALEKYFALEPRIDPTRRPIVHFYIAYMRWRQGRYTESIERFRQALAGDPFLPLLSLGLAEALLYDRQYDEASRIVGSRVAAGVDDPRVGQFRALIPILAAGDADAGWNALMELPPQTVSELLGMGLRPEGRILLRVFADRIAGYEMAPSSPLISPAVRAGYRLATAVRDAANGDPSGFPAARDELVEIAADTTLMTSFRVDVQTSLAVAMAGAGDAAGADSVLTALAADLPNADDVFLTMDLLSATAEVKAMTGDAEGMADALEALLSRPTFFSRALLDADPLWASVVADPNLASRLR